mmetsp:Transcript_8921/g.15496  ORF Transcript_8921/g.15496 Transcript_8921/m.15496 type:complete len:85 (+) Transcript_8921:169-423(+)
MAKLCNRLCCWCIRPSREKFSYEDGTEGLLDNDHEGGSHSPSDASSDRGGDIFKSKKKKDKNSDDDSHSSRSSVDVSSLHVPLM